MTLIDKLRNHSLSTTVFNRQRGIPVKVAPLQDFARQIAERLEMERGFSLVLVSDAAIRKLHKRFAGKDRPTDVLSFPDRTDGPWEVEEAYAGDVFISVETANRQKRGDLLDELKVLALHGVLHLLGYDHETDQGEMSALESKLKKEFRLC